MEVYRSVSQEVFHGVRLRLAAAGQFVRYANGDDLVTHRLKNIQLNMGCLPLDLGEPLLLLFLSMKMLNGHSVRPNCPRRLFPFGLGPNLRTPNWHSPTVPSHSTNMG